MSDENLAVMRTHRNNILRYRKLWKTDLNELERQFLERRPTEERLALEKIVASTFPLAFALPVSPRGGRDA